MVLLITLCQTILKCLKGKNLSGPVISEQQKRKGNKGFLVFIGKGDQNDACRAPENAFDVVSLILVIHSLAK